MATGPSEPAIMSLVTEIVSFIGEAAYVALHPHYGQGTFFQDNLKMIAKYLAVSRSKDEWPGAIEDFEGKGSVPIMTMHKSKGLEYHTVIFVGLEDSALFGFKHNEYDEACGFFVALSRARKRAIFTFSQKRPRKAGMTPEAQSRSEIKKLYNIMERAGVKPELISNAELSGPVVC